MIQANLLIDSHGRVLRDLRVSVTDRCNFRCLYCLPETEAAANFYRGRFRGEATGTQRISREWQPASRLLTFEEIERLVKIAVRLGIQKIRLTGGEPLLRRELEGLVGRLSAIEGIQDLAMTTNGFIFADKAKALRDAGLQRVSFSLDSLDPANFRKITGRDALHEVLNAIGVARQLGFAPLKVNAVIIRGVNDHEIEALAAFGHEQALSFRFIEFMPLDSSRSWQKDLVVSAHEILERLTARFGLRRIASDNPAETAKRWAFPDGRGEIGLIAPVSEPFCGHCNRLRVTADGQIRTCLFSLSEHDLRTPMREGATDSALEEMLRAMVWQKEERHHIGEPEFAQPQRTMSCIGG